MNTASILCFGGVIAILAASCGGSKDTGLFGSTTDTTNVPTASTTGVTPTAPPPPNGTGTTPTPPPPPPGDAGRDAGDAPCTVVSPSCHANEYCKVDGCGGTGSCAAKSVADSRGYDPVCGCDHVTYWNADIASAHGVNVAADGICEKGVADCSKEKACPVDSFCNFDQKTKSACQSGGTKSGTCWALPADCPVAGGASAQHVRLCDGINSGCTNLCDAIRADEIFYSSSPLCLTPPG